MEFFSISEVNSAKAPKVFGESAALGAPFGPPALFGLAEGSSRESSKSRANSLSYMPPFGPPASWACSDFIASHKEL